MREADSIGDQLFEENKTWIPSLGGRAEIASKVSYFCRKSPSKASDWRLRASQALESGRNYNHRGCACSSFLIGLGNFREMLLCVPGLLEGLRQHETSSTSTRLLQTPWRGL